MDLKYPILLFYLGLQFTHNGAFAEDDPLQFVSRDEGNTVESKTTTCGYEVQSTVVIRITLCTTLKDN